MSLVQRDPALHERLQHLARTARMVFVAGLPGTGKSLVIHQLAHLAVDAGRTVDLVQWDVARPAFEASPAGQRHPVVDGVTQPMIRRAVGLWARRAVAGWSQRRAAPAHLLIGETPLVGGRLIELARRMDDDAEPLLASTACRFVIPVPSRDVRGHIEAERERRATAARHPREREDAPPHVLRDLWTQLLSTAEALGIASARTGGGAYDPDIYGRVYAHVLQARTTEVLAVETILPTAAMSVYDFAVPFTDLVPSPEEAEAFVRESETRFPDAAALGREVERWWLV
jgi:hypothetical protein